MNLRVYFHNDGNELGVFRTIYRPKTIRFNASSGIHVDLKEEDGVLYLERHVLAGELVPALLPEIVSRILTVTILDRIRDLDHMALIKPGNYELGTARARARREPQDHLRRDYVEIYVQGAEMMDVIQLYDRILAAAITPVTAFAPSAV